jgi:hypothetical protein
MNLLDIGKYSQALLTLFLLIGAINTTFWCVFWLVFDNRVKVKLSSAFISRESYEGETKLLKQKMEYDYQMISEKLASCISAIESLRSEFREFTGEIQKRIDHVVEKT